MFLGSWCMYLRKEYYGKNEVVERFFWQTPLQRPPDCIIASLKWYSSRTSGHASFHFHVPAVKLRA